MPGGAVYAALLNERGMFIAYYPTAYRSIAIHGTGTGMEMMISAAAGKNGSILLDEDLHNISLQEPAAVDFLTDHVSGIRDLAYFLIFFRPSFSVGP